MIEIVRSQIQLNRVLDIIGENYDRCLYLYCNIKKYGYKNEHFVISADFENEIVLGIYFNEAIHIFSRNNVSKEAVDYIKAVSPKTIFSTVELDLGDAYDTVIEGVYCFDNKHEISQDQRSVDQIGGNDINLLVEFLLQYSESYRRGYSKEALLLQLKERLSEGYSRYFAVKEHGKVVGCAFTKAEIQELIIVGGILVSPENRGKGIGKLLCRHKANVALSENRDSYCFIDNLNKASIHLHESVGYRKCAEVHKYIKH